MAGKTGAGPGRADRKGSSAGRATKKAATSSSGSRVGRYTPPEVSGRYTRPIPKKVRRSAAWYGPLLLLLLVLGVMTIILNYVTVLPGSVSAWYLVGGIALMFIGIGMATRYR